MGDFRARKRPPPRGEVGAERRGEPPLAGDAVSVEDNVGASIGIGEQALDLKHPNDDGALTGPELRGVTHAVTDHGDAGAERDELRTERVQRLERSHLVVTHKHGERLHGRAIELVPALTGGHTRVSGELVGFCCVCHAHDSRSFPRAPQVSHTKGPLAVRPGGPSGVGNLPPLPQLDVPSNSQVTLAYPTVGSSLSGMPPTLAELGTPDTQLLAPTTTSAASDIPRAHRMVVPATVYTWHTAAQVLRPASDMPHATDHGVGSSVSNMPHGSGRRTCPGSRRAGHP